MREICPICHKQFVSQESYELHMLNHTIKELIEVIKCLLQGITVE
jgi:Zinc finger, C2H2 type.